MRNTLYLLFILLFPVILIAQEVYIPLSNRNLEFFLDRLATNHVIELNSSIKPLSASRIADFLKIAEKNSSSGISFKKEVIFYSKNYGIEINDTSSHIINFRHFKAELKSSKINPLLRIAIVPLINQQYWSNGVNKTEIGAGIYGYVGKTLGFAFGVYRGIQSEILASPVMFSREPGHNYQRNSDGSAGYYEWTGQITASWKWGSVGIIKERFDWGNNMHGANIFSSKAPSFPYFQLKVKPAKWIEFTYIHGKLNSKVADSNMSFERNNGELHYRKKYLAANFLTVTPWKYLNISFGNSAIYGDKIQAAYFIPVLFYKSVDHTLYPEPGATGGTNSQMFLDISSRQIKHLHLYMTLFIDEFKISRIRNPEENNFLSWKCGFTVWDFPVQKLSIRVEGTRTLPLVYQHNVNVTTYECDFYNLGNYIRDNSQELFISLRYSPIHFINCDISFMYGEHGDDFKYSELQDPVRLPVLKNITYSKQAIACRIDCELSGNSLLFINGEYSNIKGYPAFTPDSFRGSNTIISAGFNTGF